MITRLVSIVIFGAIISFIFSHIFIAIAKRTRLTLDDPTTHDRRIHEKPTPRIGGMSLLLALGVTVLVWLPAGYWANQQIQGLVVGAILIALMGIVDDVRGLSGRVKLLGLFTITAFVIWQFQLIIPNINNPLGGILDFSLGLGAAISFAWIVVTTNTMNFIDGIDGLSTSVTISFALVVGTVAVLFNQQELAIFLAALLGCYGGFLPINWHRARAFLGDGGAMLAGFIIGVLSILSGAKLATALLVMGLPILDVINTLIMRWRRGQSLFTADNEHLHYRLIRKGLTTSQTVLVIAGISLGFGLLALVNNTTFKLVSLALLGVVSQWLIWWSMEPGMNPQPDERKRA